MDYQSLKKVVIFHCELYYVQDEPVLNDAEFDELYDRLERMEQRQGFSDADSPTKNVGYRKGKVKHRFQRYSLKKTYDIEDIDRKKFPIETRKLDGTNLGYDKGQLTTRGDGVKGEDVTHLKQYIQGIPDIKDDCVFVGEVMTVNKVENYRNYVSGALNSKKAADIKDKGLIFIVHDVLGMTDDYYDRMDIADSIGFNTVFNKQFQDFPSDGMVYRVETYKEEQELGYTGKHPRFAIALKEKNALTAQTVLQDIYWSVGRTGVVTPVGIVEEVELDDAKINRVTLHNFKYVLDNNLGAGDIIEIERQIIPSFVKVIEHSQYNRFGREDAEEQLGVDTWIDGPRLYADQEFNSRNVQHFCKQLKIAGLGPKTIEKAKITTIPELFTTDWSLYAGDKNGEKIHYELQQDKDYQSVLSALGIPRVGRTMSKTILEKLPAFSDLRSINTTQIRTVGPLTKYYIEAWLDDNEFWVYDLPDNFKLVADKVNTSDIIKICVTGKLDGLTKSAFAEKVSKYNVEVINSVTKDCSYLISADEKESGKSKQAKRYGIQIIPFKANQKKILNGKLFEDFRYSQKEEV